MLIENGENILNENQFVIAFQSSSLRIGFDSYDTYDAWEVLILQNDSNHPDGFVIFTRKFLKKSNQSLTVDKIPTSTIEKLIERISNTRYKQLINNKFKELNAWTKGDILLVNKGRRSKGKYGVVFWMKEDHYQDHSYSSNKPIEYKFGIALDDEKEMYNGYERYKNVDFVWERNVEKVNIKNVSDEDKDIFKKTANDFATNLIIDVSNCANLPYKDYIGDFLYYVQP